MSYFKYLSLLAILFPFYAVGELKLNSIYENDNYISYDWSDNGKWVVISVIKKNLKNFCVFDADLFQEKKCIFKSLIEQELIDTGIGKSQTIDIDWSGNRIYFSESYDEVVGIGWIDITNWLDNSFRIKNIDNITTIQDSGYSPSWDSSTEVLYFESDQEMGGIIEDNAIKQRKVIPYGIDPVVQDNFVYFSQYLETGDVAGIARYDRKSSNIFKVSSGLDLMVSVSNRGDILFARKCSDGYMIMKKVVSGKSIEIGKVDLMIGQEINEIKISPDGKKALILMSNLYSRQQGTSDEISTYKNIRKNKYKLYSIDI